MCTLLVEVRFRPGLVGLLCIHAVNTWCVENKIMWVYMNVHWHGPKNLYTVDLAKTFLLSVSFFKKIARLFLLQYMTITLKSLVSPVSVDISQQCVCLPTINSLRFHYELKTFLIKFFWKQISIHINLIDSYCYCTTIKHLFLFVIKSHEIWKSNLWEIKINPCTMLIFDAIMRVIFNLYNISIIC